MTKQEDIYIYNDHSTLYFFGRGKNMKHLTWKGMYNKSILCGEDFCESTVNDYCIYIITELKKAGLLP
ncbi:MAG: hypothetical protein ACTSPU_12195, partial [Promethearchaeota archaeon]